MRQISPGFSTPEERLAPVPFYYNQAPPIYRWNQWRGVAKWDTFQRWFYSCFCGRTMESIWETECGTQTEPDIKNFGDYSDPLNWGLPDFYHPVAGAEYLAQPHAYANYFALSTNVRQANPKTGLAAQTVADDIYIASRHAYPRATFRIAMKLPSAAEIIAMHAAHGVAMDTYIGLGFEVNSQGQHLIFALELVESGATLAYRLRAYAPGQTKRTWEVNVPVTINNPDTWNWFEFEYDPPVFRFTQPVAGQTEYWYAANYAAVTELSVPLIQAHPLVQPCIFNESNAITTDHLSWHVGQWAIWPTTNSGNVYSINTRTNPSSACAPQTAIFDTGSRPYVHINLKSGCGCAYYIYHTEDGASQAANYQEVRTWRRIDDTDWTGVTDTPYGEAGIGLFNAARFLCVVQAGCNACNVQEIVFTANSGGST